MSIWSNLFGRQAIPPPAEKAEIAVGARDDSSVTMTFSDQNITFSGDLTGYDYMAILRDKQKNILPLCQLSDYYSDADPLFRGIIKEVYTPFSVADKYRLSGADEGVKAQFTAYYDRIGLENRMSSIFLQLYKYANVYVYVQDDGTVITLPANIVRVANVTVNGEPVVELNAAKLAGGGGQTGAQAKKAYLKDEEQAVRLRGYPKEAAKAVKAGDEWVQLDPARTFVLQDLKEDWQRYAIPMAASCLKAFAKKELISRYEDSLINLGARAFVHVKYGDPKNEVLPDVGGLRQVSEIFRKAMTGTALAVTNNWCGADVIQPKTDDVFHYDKYKGVNADILSAGGISGVIVSGRTEEGSTFASAQVSMQTAAIRIRQMKDRFCDMMNRINRCAADVIHVPELKGVKEENIPKFTFPPVDLAGDKAFRETCFRLWEKGVLSSETMLNAHGHDIEQEAARKAHEKESGMTDILMPPGVSDKGKPEGERNDKTGRPRMDDDERNSDPGKAETGRQPKPSNPDGSTD